MKNCFMKKLLSSFLALTMVATVIPANVVSAVEAQTQVVKDQNKQSQAKKASKWSDKTKAGLIAGCAAFLLAAIQANLYFKLNLAKKEAEKLKNMTANSTNEEFNDQFKKAINEINSAINQTKGEVKTQLEGTKKWLSEGLDQAKAQMNSLANNANMTALKLYNLENNMNMTATQIHSVDTNADEAGLSKTKGLFLGLNAVCSHLFLRRLFRAGSHPLSLWVQGLGTLVYLGAEMFAYRGYSAAAPKLEKFWNTVSDSAAAQKLEEFWNTVSEGFGNFTLSWESLGRNTSANATTNAN